MSALNCCSSSEWSLMNASLRVESVGAPSSAPAYTIEQFASGMTKLVAENVYTNRSL